MKKLRAVAGMASERQRRDVQEPEVSREAASAATEAGGPDMREAEVRAEVAAARAAAAVAKAAAAAAVAKAEAVEARAETAAAMAKVAAQAGEEVKAVAEAVAAKAGARAKKKVEQRVPEEREAQKAEASRDAGAMRRRAGADASREAPPSLAVMIAAASAEVHSRVSSPSRKSKGSGVSPSGGNRGDRGQETQSPVQPRRRRAGITSGKGAGVMSRIAASLDLRPRLWPTPSRARAAVPAPTQAPAPDLAPATATATAMATAPSKTPTPALRPTKVSSLAPGFKGQAPTLSQMTVKPKTSTKSSTLGIGMTVAQGSDSLEGWLSKWSNSLKSYQPRWFMLSHGLLSYYCDKAEMHNTCQGTISLASATITVEDSHSFVISNGDFHAYRLKASSETEQQDWIKALKLAKGKAVKMPSHFDDSEEEASTSSRQAEKMDLQKSLHTLSQKVDDVTTYTDLVASQGQVLQSALRELETIKIPKESHAKMEQVTEHAVLLKDTSSTMTNVCKDFLKLVLVQSEKWQKSLQLEKEKRIQLEEALEQLAEQHNRLERTLQSDAAKGTEKDEARQESGASSQVAEVPGDPGQECAPSEIHGASQASGQYKQPVKKIKKAQRIQIPYKPTYSLNLWSMIKNYIGKELSKIPLLVNFSEPLSMLQRLTEDLEYHELLDQAAKCEDSLEQLCYVATFITSSYSTTVFRTNMPFSPLLGETFELDLMEENGFRSLCEQVNLHPPVAAHHVDSRNGWTFYQDIEITGKFHGKFLDITPSGTVHCVFHATGHHYTWKKALTTVNNIILGKLWIDQSGEIEIANHKTGDKCILKFVPHSYLSQDVPRKVTGQVLDPSQKVHFTLLGTWDEKIECFRVLPAKDADPGVVLWKRNPLPKNAENMYYFSEFALTLNALEDGVAPTDSRLRPDQRLMENGYWDEANAEKWRLEEKQRLATKKREGKAVRAADSGTVALHKALWFEQKEDPITKELIHMYRGGYWECKENRDWGSCPNIF